MARIPQLVKGGKWVFGWARVNSDCCLVVPPSALIEYDFHEGELLLVIPGSRTSGGFALAAPSALDSSSIGGRKVLGKTQLEAGKRVYIPVHILDKLEIVPGSKLLVVRGSGLAVGLVSKGPIFEEAQKHPEIEEF